MAIEFFMPPDWFDDMCHLLVLSGQMRNLRAEQMALYIDHELLLAARVCEPETIHDRKLKGHFNGAAVYAIPLDCGLDVYAYYESPETGRVIPDLRINYGGFTDGFFTD